LVGNVVYDNLLKTMLMMVVDDDKLESAVKIIEDSARTGNIGNMARSSYPQQRRPRQ
jgi:nitrogen regulatory protein PII 1